LGKRLILKNEDANIGVDSGDWRPIAVRRKDIENFAARKREGRWKRANRSSGAVVFVIAKLLAAAAAAPDISPWNVVRFNLKHDSQRNVRHGRGDLLKSDICTVLYVALRLHS
jgi:hypothetical protein